MRWHQTLCVFLGCGAFQESQGFSFPVHFALGKLGVQAPLDFTAMPPQS